MEIPENTRTDFLTLNRTRAGSRTTEQLCDDLNLSSNKGLSSKEVIQRREECGPNRLREAESKNTIRIFIEQFKSAIVVMLLAAVRLSLAEEGVKWLVDNIQEK